MKVAENAKKIFNSRDAESIFRLAMESNVSDSDINNPYSMPVETYRRLDKNGVEAVLNSSSITRFQNNTGTTNLTDAFSKALQRRVKVEEIENFTSSERESGSREDGRTSASDVYRTTRNKRVYIRFR